MGELVPLPPILKEVCEQLQLVIAHIPGGRVPKKFRVLVHHILQLHRTDVLAALLFCVEGILVCLETGSYVVRRPSYYMGLKANPNNKRLDISSVHAVECHEMIGTHHGGGAELLPVRLPFQVLELGFVHDFSNEHLGRSDVWLAHEVKLWNAIGMYDLHDDVRTELLDNSLLPRRHCAIFIRVHDLNDRADHKTLACQALCSCAVPPELHHAVHQCARVSSRQKRATPLAHGEPN
mmetsp:Transcript_41171/g.114434  ORF Transcript_41171/g.114434 Transcript_41171/m.114434 type:complete len:236 (-) Transcript_41171:64-771(-)